MPTDELSEKILETLKKEFQKKYDSDTLLKELKKQIEKGNGDYELAHAYSKRTGEILSEIFNTKINGDILPDSRMYFQMANDTIKPMLEQNHNIINEICEDIQTNLNSEAGIKIKPATVMIDENRINGIMTMIWQSEKFNEIKPQLSSATTNYTQSVVDKNIKANADLHYKSGFTPKIERISKGKCCKWCENLSGVYNYEDVKDKGNNVFRRHENCNCLVIYKPVSGKKQNVHTKQFIRNEDEIKKRKNYNIDIPHSNSIIKANRSSIPINIQLLASKEKQFGKKVGKHAIDFGLDPSKAEDREKFQNIINNIVKSPNRIAEGNWRGQEGDVLFYIKGEDVVVMKQNGEFITILKGGVNNARVKNARNKKI